jgi:hypothetical protein
MPPPVAPQMITISKMTASDRMKRFFLNQGRLALGWALCEMVCALASFEDVDSGAGVAC